MNRPSRPSRAGLQGSSRNTALLAGGGTQVILKAAPDTTTSTSLTWNEAVPKPDNYRVERSTDGTTFSTVTTLANTDFSYTDTGRTESTQYWYRIVPILGGVDQTPSNIADTWTVPATPTSLTATAVSSSVIDLAWTDVSTGNTGYVIEARRPPTTGTYGVIGTAGATATTFSATSLIASTQYEFRVAATNPATQSAYSNEATATTQSATVPNAPTGVSASASTTAVAVTITWTDASTDEDNFNVYRNTSNTTVGATLLNSPLAGIQTYTDNATNNPSAPPAIGTTYYYWVSASNGVGESAKTAASQNATGGVTTLNVPAAPTSLTATAASSTQINLAWTDNATNETGYIVERRSPAGSGSYSQIATPSAGATSYNNTGLTASTQYEYRVAATNAAGNSAYSNAASATTQAGTYNVEYLVVAGGGGGGNYGGGGAGGYKTATGFSLTPGTSYTITVGAGGTGAQRGNSGSNSVFSSITSTGGGGGGALEANLPGRNGGSGGGGGVLNASSTAGGTGTSGEGNNGGNGATSGNYGAGGGGGADAAGSNGTTTVGGNGGNGKASSITGTSVTRGGGGGGGAWITASGSAGGTGGTGGGGNGGANTTTRTAGSANTGGGGGGRGEGGPSLPGENGGSGLVIIRMASSNAAGVTTTGAPSITTSGSDTIYTFSASGTLTA